MSIPGPRAATRPQVSRDRGRWEPFVLGVLVLAAAFSMMSLDASTVDSLVKEDGPVEWVGALALLAGSGMFFASFALSLRHEPASERSRAGIWALLVFALALLLFGGEEVSWGQRLFGWGTPEALSEVNVQGETTLHNLQPFQGTTLDGDRLFRIAWMAMFVLVPLIAWLVQRSREPLRRLLPVVPVWLAGLFVAAWVVSHIATDLFAPGWAADHAAGSASTEIQEASVEVLMAVAAFLTLRDVRRARRPCAECQ